MFKNIDKIKFCLEARKDTLETARFFFDLYLKKKDPHYLEVVKEFGERSLWWKNKIEELEHGIIRSDQ